MIFTWRFVLELWIGHEIGSGKYSVQMNEVTVPYCSLILPKMLDFSILIFEISVSHFIYMLNIKWHEKPVEEAWQFCCLVIIRNYLP